MEFEITPPIIVTGGECKIESLARHEISLHKVRFSRVYGERGYAIGSTRFTTEKGDNERQIVIRMFIDLVPKTD